jgi:molecular chaperone GrpE
MTGEQQPYNGSMSEQEKMDAQQKADEGKTGLLQELAECKDKYFRALAEVENTRKRLQKEKIEAQTFAIQNVIIEFLQPLDHFEQAIKHLQKAPPEVFNWLQGFQMILTQFKQVLQDNGVVDFDSVGSQFDPHLHEALETQETAEIANGTVIQEFLRGYKMAGGGVGRIIRPAKVKVAVAPTTSNENELLESDFDNDADSINGA